MYNDIVMKATGEGLKKTRETEGFRVGTSVFAAIIEGRLNGNRATVATVDYFT